MIIHELGHAIHDHINPLTGAAAIPARSARVSATTGRSASGNGSRMVSGGFAKMFVWDGIDACWGGRRADH